MVDDLDMGWHDWFRAISYSDRTFTNSLNRFSDSTLDIIDAAIVWNAKTNNPSHELMYAAIVESPEHLTREIMFYRPSFNDSTKELRSFVVGIHLLDRFLGHKQLETLAGEDVEIVSALLNVTHALNDHAAGRYLRFDSYYRDELAGFISDPKLQEFIVNHHRKIDVIVDYIEERGNADIESMTAFLENDTVLRQGTL